jgi:hypothetical protein
MPEAMRNMAGHDNERVYHLHGVRFAIAALRAKLEGFGRVGDGCLNVGDDSSGTSLFSNNRGIDGHDGGVRSSVFDLDSIVPDYSSVLGSGSIAPDYNIPDYSTVLGSERRTSRRLHPQHHPRRHRPLRQLCRLPAPQHDYPRTRLGGHRAPYR